MEKMGEGCLLGLGFARYWNKGETLEEMVLTFNTCHLSLYLFFSHEVVKRW